MTGQIANTDLSNKILAGNATFTILNNESGNRFTFKIQQPKDNMPHFVKVMTGPDNESNYQYLGTIFNKSSYIHGRKSKIGKDAQSNKVFTWFFNNINNLPEQIEIYHSNRCLKCGRKLTTPQSVKDGFGPECMKQIDIYQN